MLSSLYPGTFLRAASIAPASDASSILNSISAAVTSDDTYYGKTLGFLDDWDHPGAVCGLESGVVRVVVGDEHHRGLGEGRLLGQRGLRSCR